MRSDQRERCTADLVVHTRRRDVLRVEARVRAVEDRRRVRARRRAWLVAAVVAIAVVVVDAREVEALRATVARELQAHERTYKHMHTHVFECIDIQRTCVQSERED